MNIHSKILVGVIMGSKSDWKTMIHCSETLKKFNWPTTEVLLLAEPTFVIPNLAPLYLIGVKHIQNHRINKTMY